VEAAIYIVTSYNQDYWFRDLFDLRVLISIMTIQAEVGSWLHCIEMEIIADDKQKQQKKSSYPSTNLDAAL